MDVTNRPTVVYVEFQEQIYEVKLLERQITGEQFKYMFEKELNCNDEIQLFLKTYDDKLEQIKYDKNILDQVLNKNSTLLAKSIKIKKEEEKITEIQSKIIVTKYPEIQKLASNLNKKSENAKEQQIKSLRNDCQNLRKEILELRFEHKECSNRIQEQNEEAMNEILYLREEILEQEDIMNKILELNLKLDWYPPNEKGKEILAYKKWQASQINELVENIQKERQIKSQLKIECQTQNYQIIQLDKEIEEEQKKLEEWNRLKQIQQNQMEIEPTEK